jgi:hypothetical protein
VCGTVQSDRLPKASGTAVAILVLLLPLGFDQFQHAELLVRDILLRDLSAPMLLAFRV